MKYMSRLFVLLLAPFAAHAEDCGAGSYIDNAGTCTPCQVGYYCPGDSAMHTCGDASIPSYADEPGLSACKPCPAVTNLPTGVTISRYFYWIADGSDPRSLVHTDIDHCRVLFTRPTGHGVIGFSCSHNTDGYTTHTTCQGEYGHTYCDAGRFLSPDNPAMPNGYQHGANWVSAYQDLLNAEFCLPVGIGYYSPANTAARTACNSGTSTRTETAASANDCIALCGAGATQLKTSTGLAFNIYRDKLSSPALAIGLSGGTCYVPLDTGTATNAINIKNGTTNYHTIY